MSFSRKLFRGRDKLRDFISSHFSFLFGYTSSSKAVTEHSAMQVTAVYAWRCVEAF